MARPSRLVLFLVVVGIAFCLYLPFLSKNYDLNGLAEAAAVKAGTPGALLTPNHMLYRPVGYSLQVGLAPFGWNGGIVPLLQVLSAAFGALGVGFVYLMLSGITLQRTIAFWVSLILGVSWSWWTLSTDVYYFSMAAMLVAATMALFVHANSASSFVACGLIAGLAILACQANVFLLPGLGVVLVLREWSLGSPHGVSRAFRRLVLLGGSAISLVGVAFIIVGALFYDRRTPAQLIEWASSYSGGDPLPMWGDWSPHRLLLAAGSAFKSIVAMDVWMFPFFQRYLPLVNGEMPPWIAPLGFALFTAILVAAYISGPAKRESHNRSALWLLILYVAYMPFIVWWEPMEARWFILPNVFLAGLVSIVAARWSSWRYFKFVLPAVFFILGGTNMAISAWPKRFAESLPTQTAACVASHMRETDVFLASEWNWAGYIEYVHNRQVLNFLHQIPRKEEKTPVLEKIDRMIVERQQQGGAVYMMDIKVYTPEYMKWLEEQTGLTAEDLKKYSGPPAFDCPYGEFFRVDSIQHGI